MLSWPCLDIYKSILINTLPLQTSLCTTEKMIPILMSLFLLKTFKSSPTAYRARGKEELLQNKEQCFLYGSLLHGHVWFSAIPIPSPNPAYRFHQSKCEWYFSQKEVINLSPVPAITFLPQVKWCHTTECGPSMGNGQNQTQCEAGNWPGRVSESGCT